ncbi:MAG: hypothetical protein H7325_01775 [Pedobacter sp.]|nr:hypothetical protein [Pedobacter sp.]
MIVFLFLNRQVIRPALSSSGIQKLVLALVVLFSLAFGIYTLNFLPIIDFLPYKVGAHIPSLMVIPPGEKPDEYEIVYQMKNKKTGDKKALTDKEYLKTEIWKDENWEIIGDPEQKLLKKGYEPEIRDLIIADASGTDYTKEIIENPYYNLVYVAYNLSDTDENAVGKLNALALNATRQFNIRSVLLTSTSAQTASDFVKKNNLFAEVFYADAVPLKSMIRSNPGVLLFKNGVIVNKWSANQIPSFEELSKKYFNN